jgi:hypothetical protein
MKSISRALGTSLPNIVGRLNPNQPPPINLGDLQGNPDTKSGSAPGGSVCGTTGCPSLKQRQLERKTDAGGN